MKTIFCADSCPPLEEKSLAAVITSPPYAEQRAKHYDSVPESEYPAWTVKWMDDLRPALSDSGSILVIIRPHIRNGELSDYVLRTRLAVRDAGWVECEELIWYKPDGPPLGSTQRPRRTYESILWYSKTGRPWADLVACGSHTHRLGFRGSNRFPEATNKYQRSEAEYSGTTRISDVLVHPINKESWPHPAMCPVSLVDQLILTFSRPGDVVCDPFAGSFTTAVSAERLGRGYICWDSNPAYVDIGRKRLDL